MNALDDFVAMLRAAADRARLRMLALCADGELTVTEITEILGMTQPAVSRHLKILAEAGLLVRFREGAWAFYRLADDGAAGDAARWLVAACNPADETRRRDLRRLGEVRARRSAEAQAYFQANATRWSAIRSLHVDEALVEDRLVALAPASGVHDFLDLGVGGGRILELLGPRADRAAGLDINQAMLTVARDRIAAAGLTHCSLRLGDLYAAPFEDSRFDLITAHLVLHFLDKPARAIREVARMLRPGGRAILADFAPHDLDHLRAEQAHRRLGFSTAEVARWLEDAGLELLTEERLKGDPLTVCIWLAARPGAAGAQAAA